MAATLIKLLFYVLSSLSNLVSLVLFKGAAVFIVLFLQILKAPGLAINCVLCLVKELVKKLLEVLLQLLIDGLKSVANSVPKLASGIVSGSSKQSLIKIKELIEKARKMYDSLSNIFPQAFTGGWGMATKMLLDVAKNFMDAINYVIQNA